MYKTRFQSSHITLSNYRTDPEQTTDDIKQSEPQFNLKIKTKSCKPLLESLAIPSPLSSLCEIPPTNLPSPVLTENNYKEWSINNFNEYEKQLHQEITDLKTQLEISLTDNKKQSTMYEIKHKKKKKRKPASLSFQNCEEWSQNDMNEYEKELSLQFSYLSNEIASVR
eukprot:470765_1